VLPIDCRTSWHTPLPGLTAGQRFTPRVRLTQEGAPDAAD